jgi:hypothetical protein
MRLACLSILVVTIAASCEKSWTPLQPNSSELRIARPDATSDALNNAKLADYAVIFVHVDWSIYSRFHGEFFDRFVEAYLLAERKPYVHFYCIDFTAASTSEPEYTPLSTWDGWKELESKKGGSLLGAGGEFVWVRRGQVLKVQSPAAFKSTREAIATTQRVFAN